MTAPQHLPAHSRLRLVCWLMVFILSWQSALFPTLSTLTRGNGVVTRYAYDEQNRLKEMANVNSQNMPLSRFRYRLREDGKRTAIGESLVNADNRVSTRSLGYDYDNAGKLTSETGQDGLGVAYANTWTYDAVGNRIAATTQKAASAGATTWAHTTSVSSVFNANDQLTASSSVVDGGTAAIQNYGYDANGAEKTVASASGNSTNGWNFEGKLTATALAGADGVASGGSSNAFDAQQVHAVLAWYDECLLVKGNRPVAPKCEEEVRRTKLARNLRKPQIFHLLERERGMLIP